MKAIYCAGEQSQVVVDILREAGGTENIVLIDDDPAQHTEQIAGHDVIWGLDEFIAEYTTETQCIVAFGDRSGVRLRLANRLSTHRYGFFNAIHPSTQISETAELGVGLMINAQSYIGPEVVIGDHVLIDSCVTISHGSILHDGSTVTPNATLAGGVVVEEDAYIGPSATIIEDLTVGRGAVVGAGAVATQDVSPNTTVAGVPATDIEE
jgi:sugar O-acyltransferase (sialic acid O-acetyltransferase NeuD family)